MAKGLWLKLFWRRFSASSWQPVLAIFSANTSPAKRGAVAPAGWAGAEARTVTEPLGLSQSQASVA